MKKKFNPYDWLKKEYKPRVVTRNYDAIKAKRSEGRLTRLKENTSKARVNRSLQVVKFWD